MHRKTVSRFQVSKLAGVLVKHGVRKGDLVVIYMPMVPQAMFTMLACARIGAPHSLIFGGFASKELSVRIDHAKVGKLFVTPLLGRDFVNMICINPVSLISTQGHSLKM